ncbi:hypothetical protein COO60DRAFT_743834 [Scenedesmus sp. NREL 46B-D3]|nr:hypothetical protein COO60DRAFT_743834 [Scenedesmus sp. NREL 46B-D3]
MRSVCRAVLPIMVRRLMSGFGWCGRPLLGRGVAAHSKCVYNRPHVCTRRYTLIIGKASLLFNTFLSCFPLYQRLLSLAASPCVALAQLHLWCPRYGVLLACERSAACCGMSSSSSCYSLVGSTALRWDLASCKREQGRGRWCLYQTEQARGRPCRHLHVL